MKHDGSSKKRCKSLTSDRSNIKQDFIEKLLSKYKSISKAHRCLAGNGGSVTYPMFKEYLLKFGYHLEEKDQIELFRAFDKDNDGKINFNDLNKTVGFRIKPEEKLVFRAEIPKLYQNKLVDVVNADMV